MPVAGRDIDRTAKTEPVLREGFLDITAISPRIQGPGGADRGFIAGRSGSGKSFLARRLLTSYNSSEDWPAAFRGNVLIFDVNDNFDYPVQRTYTKANEIRIHPKYPVVSYVPDFDQMDSDSLNEFWSVAFHYKGPLIVYIDETGAFEPMFGKRFPEGNLMKAYLTRGRARNKAAILGSQRPVNIPKDIIGQAEWFYVFDLPLEDDRITMAGTIGRYSDLEEDIRDRNSLERYEFWFKNPEIRNPVKAQIIR